MTTPQNFWEFINPFEKISPLKKWEKQRVKTKKIQEFSYKSEKILYGCDWSTLISPNDWLKDCACFTSISNDTNSDQIVIDGQYFGVSSYKCAQDYYKNLGLSSSSSPLRLNAYSLESGSSNNDAFISPIESVSITKSHSSDIYQSIYNIFCVFEGVSYHIMQFIFYSDDSKFYNQNWFKSRLSIYWQFYRLKAISNWKIDELYFLYCLLTYSNWNESNSLSLKYLKDFYYTRFDYRFDFFLDKKIKPLSFQDIFPLSKVLKGGSEFIQKHNNWDIFTGWNTTNRKSKYVYTRMYQKQIDAESKWEKWLYYDYCTYSWNVRRLEFEFWSKFTTSRSKIWFYDEYFSHLLTKQVFEYVWIDPTTWPYSKSYSIEIPYESRSPFQKQRMFAQYIWLADNFIKWWVNPVEALRFWLMSKKWYSLDDIKKIFSDNSHNDELLWLLGGGGSLS